MNQDIVPLSLEYYDNNNKENEKLLKQIKYYGGFDKNISPDEKQNLNIIEFYDKDKNIIKKSKFEVLGSFISTGNVWVWGWAFPKLDSRFIQASRKLLNYGMNINENIFLKRELITSRFKISNPIQNEIYAAMGSYLSKIPFIFNYKFYYNKIDEVYTKNKDGENILDLTKEFDDDYVQIYMFITEN